MPTLSPFPWWRPEPVGLSPLLMHCQPESVLVAVWLPEQVIGAAWAIAENAIVSANISAAINNEMRLRI